jgi:hypothetical protein
MKRINTLSILLLLVFTSYSLALAADGYLLQKAEEEKSLTIADFRKPPVEYKTRPLWFWNNTAITEDKILEQIQGCYLLDGYGGFGILPFGQNFSPEYLSEDYFRLYRVALEKGRELGMKFCLYDEYGFPSGSIGAINADNTPRFKNKYPEMTIKRLDKTEETVSGSRQLTKQLPQSGAIMSVVAMNMQTLQRIDLTEAALQSPSRTVSWNVPEGEWRFMVFRCVTDGDPNVDYLDPDAVDKFIEMVHQKYYDHFQEYFGSTIDGVFYDEPTMYRANGRMWTASFNQKFQEKYGFSPTSYYPALWYSIGEETQAARNFLFGFRTELYATGFMKRIQDWCTGYGIHATGHQDNEDTKNPVEISGDIMKCYKFQDIPGIDKISGGAGRPAEKYYKLVSSSAYNWDKHLVMSETYGDMGNISWNEIYQVAMEQYSKGINYFIPHAVWYNPSNVTFLPELSYRNPIYAPGLSTFNDFIARLNILLQSKGRHVADIALLYPIASLQGSHYLDGALGSYAGGVSIPEDNYADIGELFSSDICRDFTWLHPEILDERCTVNSGNLQLNNEFNYESFKVLVLPAHQTIRYSNLRKIKDFYDNGGKIIAIGKLPSKSAEFGQDDSVQNIIAEMFPSRGAAISFSASSLWVGYEPDKAFDGSLDSRWNAADLPNGNNQWLEVDFGSDQTFNKTVISEPFDRITSYHIQYWNGAAWKNCATGTTIGMNKTNTFPAVTSSKVRLYINTVKAESASIYEFEVYLDNGPNLVTFETIDVTKNGNGGKSVFLKTGKAETLLNVLDTLVQTYDVEVENAKKLRYIHKVRNNVDIYYFANTNASSFDGYIRIKGNFIPKILDPHTGELTGAEYSTISENGEGVIRIHIELPAYKSCFIVSAIENLFDTGSKEEPVDSVPATPDDPQTGVGEISGNDLELLPNPASEKLTVRNILAFSCLEIYNTSGQKIYGNRLFGRECTIDISGFSPGLYVLRLSNESGTHATRKFIKI